MSSCSNKNNIPIDNERNELAENIDQARRQVKDIFASFQTLFDVATVYFADSRTITAHLSECYEMYKSLHWATINAATETKTKAFSIFSHLIADMEKQTDDDMAEELRYLLMGLPISVKIVSKDGKSFSDLKAKLEALEKELVEKIKDMRIFYAQEQVAQMESMLAKAEHKAVELTSGILEALGLVNSAPQFVWESVIMDLICGAASIPLQETAGHIAKAQERIDASKKSLAKAREDLKDTKENQRHTSTLNDHLQPALDSLNIIRRGVSDLRPKLEVFNSIYDLFKAHVTKHIMFLADKNLKNSPAGEQAINISLKIFNELEIAVTKFSLE